MKSILRNLFVLLILQLFVTTGFTQQTSELYTIIEYPVVPEKYCDLSEEMSETSGLIYYKNAVWTINDSGGLPEIYRIEKESGKVNQTVILENGMNNDWEDITQDENFIYTGDFGNNDGNRTDLKIYKIAKKDISEKKKITVKGEVIAFSYSDQQSLSINSRDHDYDCEAVISHDDSLIIFSKDWVNGKTKMYKLPKNPGQYSLKPLDTFETDGLITGADYFEEANSLILIGYKDHIPFMFYFRGFDGNSFGKGKVYRFNFVRLKGSQAEGIAWLNKDTVVFSTEETKHFRQQAFELDLHKVLQLINEE
jgi:hypothetical protein